MVQLLAGLTIALIAFDIGRHVERRAWRKEQDAEFERKMNALRDQAEEHRAQKEQA